MDKSLLYAIIGIMTQLVFEFTKACVVYFQHYFQILYNANRALQQRCIILIRVF